MAELRLQRSRVGRSERTVHGSDWDRFMAIRQALCAVLMQCLNLDIERALDIYRGYLELRLLRPNAKLSNGKGKPTDYDAMLVRLYGEIQAVCAATEQCAIDPMTNCISLPGSKLTLLNSVKYESVIRLLDVLALPNDSSTAPLTWRFEGKDHTLRIISKARLRAIEAHALWVLMKETSSSDQTDENGSIDAGSPPNSIDTEEEETVKPSTVDRPPACYVIARILSETAFIDQHDVLIVLTNGSIAGAKVGDMAALYGHRIVDCNDYRTVTVETVEIRRQKKFRFG